MCVLHYCSLVSSHLALTLFNLSSSCSHHPHFPLACISSRHSSQPFVANRLNARFVYGHVMHSFQCYSTLQTRISLSHSWRLMSCPLFNVSPLAHLLPSLQQTPLLSLPLPLQPQSHPCVTNRRSTKKEALRPQSRSFTLCLIQVHAVPYRSIRRSKSKGEPCCSYTRR